MIILTRKALGIEVASTIGVSGRYKLVKRTASGIILQETPWFDNLILDAGLNRWFNGTILVGASIGTGSSAPVASQTALDVFGNYTTTVQATSVVAQGSAPYYVTNTYTYRFALGALNGNYTEIGVGWASNVLFSRALIVDNLGVPTAISVTSAEQLDVYYQLRRYVPVDDVVVSKTIGGKATTVTGRAAVCTTVVSIPSWNYSVAGQVLGISVTGSITASNGTIGAVTGSIAGVTSTQGGVASAVGSYVNNSLTRTYRNTFGINDANLAGGIGAVMVQWSGAGAAFQYGFSPLVEKDSTKSFTFDYSVSLARRP